MTHLEPIVEAHELGLPRLHAQVQYSKVQFSTVQCSKVQ